MGWINIFSRKLGHGDTLIKHRTGGQRESLSGPAKPSNNFPSCIYTRATMKSRLWRPRATRKKEGTYKSSLPPIKHKSRSSLSPAHEDRRDNETCGRAFLCAVPWSSGVHARKDACYRLRIPSSSPLASPFVLRRAAQSARLSPSFSAPARTNLLGALSVSFFCCCSRFFAPSFCIQYSCFSFLSLLAGTVQESFGRVLGAIANNILDKSLIDFNSIVNNSFSTIQTCYLPFIAG